MYLTYFFVFFSIKNLLNFSTKSTVSQKLIIGKLILHSFQHIAHISCKFSHFRRTSFLVGDTLRNESVLPKIVNAINHTSKNKNLKIDFSFVLAQ